MTFKDFERKLENLIKNGISKQILENAGKIVAKNVKTRTRRGFGVNKEGGSSIKLKPLTPNYKEHRKNLKRKGTLSAETKPSKSNLTKTGEMLDSLNYKVEKNKISVLPTNKKNIKKAQYQDLQGRKFLNLNKREVLDIIDTIDKELQKDITKKGL